MSPLPGKLRPDCAQCSGLCCVAPPFDADQGFGHDKAAREPCHHLQVDFRCAIHDHLADKGYPGCISFDCFGAGQRVTQELFGGATWSQSPDIAAQILDCYERLRPLHELMALATLAAARTREATRRSQLQQTIMEIDALCTIEARPNLAQLRRDITALMRSALERDYLRD